MGFFQVPTARLVLPSEATAFSHIGPPTAAGVGRQHLEQGAEIEKMRLGCSGLIPGVDLPTTTQESCHLW